VICFQSAIQWRHSSSRRQKLASFGTGPTNFFRTRRRDDCWL